MIDLGAHSLYILLSYAGVGTVTLALIGWTIWRARDVKRRLAALEAQGIRRRSDGQPT